MLLTNTAKERLFLQQDFPSKIELYYTAEKIENGIISISGEEANHILNVMRHKVKDVLYVTDGKGSFIKSRITSAEKKRITAEIIESKIYERKFAEYVFCLPRLKNADRFEFALEKCVELGINRFIVYDAEKSVAKGDKTERWNKIALSAMKQSLNFYLPEISYKKSLQEIPKDGIKIMFEQEFGLSLQDFIASGKTNKDNDYYLIFGPEGGLSVSEQNLKGEIIRLHLTYNRLRTETAVIMAASNIIKR